MKLGCKQFAHFGRRLEGNMFNVGCKILTHRVPAGTQTKLVPQEIMQLLQGLQIQHHGMVSEDMLPGPIAVIACF